MVERMNLIAELRDAARTCSNFGYRRTLTDAADLIYTLVKRLGEDPVSDTMAALNGAWVNGLRILYDTPTEAPPNPFSGAGAAGVGTSISYGVPLKRMAA
jgi:hypothetical protein